MRKFITYCLIAAIVLCTAFVFTKSWRDVLELYLTSIKHAGLYLAISMAGYLLLLRNNLRFMVNFLHEFTHLIFAVLFWDRIRQFYVSETNGELVLSSDQKNILISLSPYYFPLPALLLMVFWDNHTGWGNIVIICSYGFYLGQNASQIIRYKNEIVEFPFWGVVIIILLNFWFSLFILAWCSGNSGSLIDLLIR